MKNFFKKITGLDKVEAEKAQVESDKTELLKQRDPKEYHTRKKEPWVNVIDIKVMKKMFAMASLNLTGTNTLLHNLYKQVTALTMIRKKKLLIVGSVILFIIC